MKQTCRAFEIDLQPVLARIEVRLPDGKDASGARFDESPDAHQEGR
jgi:hypothetical protein